MIHFVKLWVLTCFISVFYMDVVFIDILTKNSRNITLYLFRWMQKQKKNWQKRWNPPRMNLRCTQWTRKQSQFYGSFENKVYVSVWREALLVLFYCYHFTYCSYEEVRLINTRMLHTVNCCTPLFLCLSVEVLVPAVRDLSLTSGIATAVLVLSLPRGHGFKGRGRGGRMGRGGVRGGRGMMKGFGPSGRERPKDGPMNGFAPMRY